MIMTRDRDRYREAHIYPFTHVVISVNAVGVRAQWGDQGGHMCIGEYIQVDDPVWVNVEPDSMATSLAMRFVMIMATRA